MMKRLHIFFFALLLIAVLSCQKMFLPSDLDAFSRDVQFSQLLYTPVLGRTTVFTNNFNDDFSTKPLTFRISDIRTSGGEPAPELLKPFPVQVWTGRYTGTERSIAEIEEKRKWEDHPLFEIREHSGEFIMWHAATSSIVNVMPDSGYVFDVEVSNSGGRKYFTGLQLQPYRERNYEPNNADPVTGNAPSDILRPIGMADVVGDSTGIALSSNDIAIMFNRVSADGNSLTIKFLDPMNEPIDPSLFNLTDWERLVHGFNMQKTETYLKYDVAYPIPLVQIPTAYTNTQGTQAVVSFKYDRLGIGNTRVVSNIDFGFQIFQAGDWEMVVSFTNESPKFDND